MLDVGTEAVHRFTREEYERMVRAGIFDEKHVELLRGMIVEMSPHSPLHDGVVVRLNKLLVLAFGDRADVRPQSSFAAADDSEPEPDFAIVSPGGKPHEAHPRAAWLLIEVAGSSQARDLGPKAAVYAEAGVEEYWVVDAPARTVAVLTDPTPTGYATRRTVRSGEVLRPARFPDVAISVDALFE